MTSRGQLASHLQGCREQCEHVMQHSSMHLPHACFVERISVAVAALRPRSSNALHAPRLQHAAALPTNSLAKCIKALHRYLSSVTRLCLVHRNVVANLAPERGAGRPELSGATRSEMSRGCSTFPSHAPSRRELTVLTAEAQCRVRERPCAHSSQTVRAFTLRQPEPPAGKPSTASGLS